MVHSPKFKRLMRRGVDRVMTRLEVDMPRTAGDLQEWARTLAGSDEPADYFLHPVAFPLMLLPWWAERQLNGEAQPEFQLDLIESNACLYYYVRLVDNVMDGHATIERSLLPATGYFVNRFRSNYLNHFPMDHPFWEFFDSTWASFCDVTAADGKLSEIDRETFTSLVARKVSAAKIGVAAVCHRHETPGSVSLWSNWIDLFGCWHLFREDLFDWQQDLKLDNSTYFLSEAKRRKEQGELEVAWMAREGLDWGFEQLDSWMEDLRQMTFVPADTVEYLDFREDEALSQREKILPALETILQLSGGMKNE